MLGPGLRVASSWRMGRCESAIHSHLLSEGLAVHFSREQGSLSLNSTLTEVLIDVSRAPGAIETILTPLLKTRESTNHSIDRSLEEKDAEEKVRGRGRDWSYASLSQGMSGASRIWKSWEKLLPFSLPREHSPVDRTWFWTSGLPNCEIINVFYFKPLSCSNLLWQPKEANTVFFWYSKNILMLYPSRFTTISMLLHSFYQFSPLLSTYCTPRLC